MIKDAGKETADERVTLKDALALAEKLMDETLATAPVLVFARVPNT